ncbi:unnamed protein product [Allacma fusca]|uniref:Uncharacterized protein n=1 Tax=Allacma fusca TaxID=39272 RepID=A0A8J2KF84_9HEXA|nr:unnamed protein product [Allacma fusca]
MRNVVRLRKRIGGWKCVLKNVLAPLDGDRNSEGQIRGGLIQGFGHCRIKVAKEILLNNKTTSQMRYGDTWSTSIPPNSGSSSATQEENRSGLTTVSINV